MFIDMHRDPNIPLDEILVMKRSVGVTLYQCDARVAAYSGSPPVVSDQNIHDYFEGTGECFLGVLSTES